MSIEGSCHCGAVRFVIDEAPAWLTDCNCSLCRRIGALWMHTDSTHATITTDADATRRYVQGDRTIAYHTCKTCGCTTHWTGLRADNRDRLAFDLRLADPGVVAQFRVRHFDGAESWAYLD